jgi:predicted NAD/FAD-binding protein
MTLKSEVHLFEKRDRLGGHSHTVVHDVAGRALLLDTGFIVYNEATYPLLTRLFAELSVETQASEMSFSVSCADPDMEYASHGLRGLFADPSLVLSTAYLKMLVDVVRFGRRRRRILAVPGDPRVTISEFLADDRFIRMWGFHLATCEAAFRDRQIGVLQLALSRTGRGAEMGTDDR